MTADSSGPGADRPPGELLAEMERAGVIEMDADEVAVTDQYRLLREENYSGCQTVFLTRLRTNRNLDRETLADYITLRQMMGPDAYSHEELLRMIHALQRTLDETPRSGE